VESLPAWFRWSVGSAVSNRTKCTPFREPGPTKSAPHSKLFPRAESSGWLQNPNGLAIWSENITREARIPNLFELLSHRYSPTIREAPSFHKTVKTLTTEEAVRHLRSKSKWAQLVHDTYLDADIEAAADRFALSGEFAAVMELVGSRLQGATVVDLGAGNGMAGRAFAQNGAGYVFAIEPDPSPEIGRGAIERICAHLPLEARNGVGEEIPLDGESADLVYARQVLHHTSDLNKTLSECARILRPGGHFLACREHVVDNDEQLALFLAGHPVHQLTGGEGAYSLDEYTNAITSAGLKLERVLDPWASPINTAPAANTVEGIAQIPQDVLRTKLGFIGTIASFLPGVKTIVWHRLRRPRPGRLYSFFARKP